MRRQLAVLGLLLAACGTAAREPLPSPVPPPPSSPAPTPVSLRPPALAILADAQVGLSRTSGRDHLTAAEAARDQPDQQGALQLYRSWGWVEESLRTWAGGDRSASETVLLTLRAENARVAYAAWAGHLSGTAGACGPPLASRLDECTEALSDSGVLVVGRLDAELFLLLGSGVDVLSLARLQADQLRAAQ